MRGKWGICIFSDIFPIVKGGKDMKKLFNLLLTFAIAFLFLLGCGSKSHVSGISITVESWGESDGKIAHNAVDKKSFSDIEKGTVLFEDGEFQISVDSVDNKEVTLHYNGMSIKKDDGTISLFSDEDTVVLKYGEEISLQTRTMDAGTVVTLTYRWEIQGRPK